MLVWQIVYLRKRGLYDERIYEIISKLDTKALEAEKERNELVP